MVTKLTLLKLSIASLLSLILIFYIIEGYLGKVNFCYGSQQILPNPAYSTALIKISDSNIPFEANTKDGMLSLLGNSGSVVGMNKFIINENFYNQYITLPGIRYKLIIDNPYFINYESINKLLIPDYIYSANSDIEKYSYVIDMNLTYGFAIFENYVYILTPTKDIINQDLDVIIMNILRNKSTASDLINNINNHQLLGVFSGTDYLFNSNECFESTEDAKAILSTLEYQKYRLDNSLKENSKLYSNLIAKMSNIKLDSMPTFSSIEEFESSLK